MILRLLVNVLTTVITLIIVKFHTLFQFIGTYLMAKTRSISVNFYKHLKMYVFVVISRSVLSLSIDSGNFFFDNGNSNHFFLFF